LSNLDLGNVINGFPGDPLVLCPFDFCFTQEKIIKTWIKVGFMPHTGNAALDQKVHHKLVEGGAPVEAGVRMEKLVEDYAERRQKLMVLGFNGEVLDLKPKMATANSSVLAKDEEELIKEIMEKKIISKAGGLYKVGVIIANCRVATQAAQQDQASKRQMDAEAIQKCKAKEKSDLTLARDAFQCWVDKGRKVTLDGHLDIKTKKDVITFI
jgi:hypothetical protein